MITRKTDDLFQMPNNEEGNHSSFIFYEVIVLISELSWDLYVIVNSENVELNGKSSLRCIFKQRREFSVILSTIIKRKHKTQSKWY